MLYHTNKLPTHLIAGVRKSATSWIWKQLCDREDVSTYKLKETHFFDQNFSQGKNWYQKHFTPNRVVVDCTPDYFMPGFAGLIKQHLPFVKVMVCLRNPIDRAFSRWKFARYIGSIPIDMKFYQAWVQNIKNLRIQGLYDVSTSEYIQIFKNNFHVIYFDELQNDAWSFIQKVYDFLDIKPEKTKYFDKKWMPRVDDDEKKLERYQTINKNQFMKPFEKKNLINYYKDSILKTSELLGKDLSDWLK